MNSNKLKLFAAGALFFSISAVANAAHVDCDVWKSSYNDLHATPKNPYYEHATPYKNLPLTHPDNSAPGTMVNNGTFDLGKNYEMNYKINITTQMDPKKPVDFFNDYVMSVDITVVKIENGKKRAVGYDIGQTTATQSHGKYNICDATVCTTADADNVDALTAAANMSAGSTMFTAAEAGLFAKDEPMFFAANCTWYK